MKFLIFVFACIALAAADVSHLAQADGYHYDAPVHHEEVAAAPAPAPAPEYLPPAEEHHHEEVAPAPIPAPAPAPEYLPPQSEEIAAEPIGEAIAEEIIAPESAHLGDNGYEYRTVKRYRYRLRY